jgi:hypothetical protein
VCPYLVDSSTVTNGVIGALLGSVSLLAAVVVLVTPETLGKSGKRHSLTLTHYSLAHYSLTFPHISSLAYLYTDSSHTQ